MKKYALVAAGGETKNENSQKITSRSLSNAYKLDKYLKYRLI